VNPYFEIDMAFESLPHEVNDCRHPRIAATPWGHGLGAFESSVTVGDWKHSYKKMLEIPPATCFFARFDVEQTPLARVPQSFTGKSDMRRGSNFSGTTISLTHYDVNSDL
jgi:hypothetical protein